VLLQEIVLPETFMQRRMVKTEKKLDQQVLKYPLSVLCFKSGSYRLGSRSEVSSVSFARITVILLKIQHYLQCYLMGNYLLDMLAVELRSVSS